MDNKSKILVIASHMDDEILGCGGTLKKHIENGDKVYVLYISSGESDAWEKEILDIRKGHAINVSKYMGFEEIFFADLPLIQLDKIPRLEVVKAIQKNLYSIKPDILYCHYPTDINSDHRIVYESTIIWCRASKSPFLNKVMLYEIFGSTTDFKPNYYVDITSQAEFKLKSMSMYETEVNAQTRNLDTTKTHMKYRGCESNTDFAEAFYLYSLIER